MCQTTEQLSSWNRGRTLYAQHNQEILWFSLYNVCVPTIRGFATHHSITTRCINVVDDQCIYIKWRPFVVEHLLEKCVSVSLSGNLPLWILHFNK